MEHIDYTLYQLQPADINAPPPQSDKIMKLCMKQIDSFHDNLSKDAEHKIKQVIKIHNTVYKCVLFPINAIVIMRRLCLICYVRLAAGPRGESIHTCIRHSNTPCYYVTNVYQANNLKHILHFVINHPVQYELE